LRLDRHWDRGHRSEHVGVTGIERFDGGLELREREIAKGR
jgi:hypothetical protein